MSEEAVKLAISTERMIFLIKDKSCIWDRMDPSYRDKFCREKAWYEIYKELYPTFDNLKEGQKIRIGQQISKKWFNIRDAYVKSIRGPKRRPYIYSQAMSFLDPVILGDRQDAQDYLEEQSMDGEPEIWLNESSFVDVDVNESQAKKPRHEIKEYLDVSENDTIVNIFSKMINREEDEDRAFFTSITPTVKTLTDSAKIEFRIEVMKLLQKLKSDTNNEIIIKTNDSDNE
ncbi:uncharacterized protein LOC124540877 [Vanessa cardui]|uniref:uncharacterized protein LOC124540877 n=1 Tax=Vanessa cardui TaxID=171605 RepID=UPI001F12DE7E|nr:uncharacterized protein LOC124540877 [Vanessa cardui]